MKRGVRGVFMSGMVQSPAGLVDGRCVASGRPDHTTRAQRMHGMRFEPTGRTTRRGVLGWSVASAMSALGLGALGRPATALAEHLVKPWPVAKVAPAIGL